MSQLAVIVEFMKEKYPGVRFQSVSTPAATYVHRRHIFDSTIVSDVHHCHTTISAQPPLVCPRVASARPSRPP
jgi:hypothetical protein